MNKPSDVLEIRESTLYNKKAKEDIKIASIGDIHISRLVGNKDINNIYESLCSEDPDYICILGDIIDSPKELMNEKSVETLKLLMRNCSSVAPTMVILGSHDFLYDHVDSVYDTEVWSELEEIPDVHVLNDKIYKDNRIVIGGYRQKDSAYNNPTTNHMEDAVAYYEDFISNPCLYEGLPKNLPKVLLTHSPEPIKNVSVQELLSVYDVIITGHYHNGCVPSFLEHVYPKNAGIITPRQRMFPKQARGVIKLDSGSYLIYSGGWTKMSNSTPKLLHPLDMICNRQMDLTTLTSNKEYEKEKIKIKKLILKK